MAELTTVCVTGASGFLGSYVVKLLLERKTYFIHATVRDPSNISKVQHLLDLPGASARLKLFRADLLEPRSFDEAMAACVGVFHTASPFFLKNQTEANIVVPAVEGTKNVLESIKRSSGTIKKVILTSSTAAVYATFGELPPEHVYTESDWSNVEKMKLHQTWYPLGKTLAEQFAHTFMSEELPQVQFLVMNPTWILGPMVQPTLNESSRKIHTYLSGKSSGVIPNEAKSLVDVRDVALAHVLGFERAQAKSGRYLLIGTSAFESEICQELQIVSPESVIANIPTQVSTSGPIMPVFGPVQPNRLLFSCEKVKQELGLVDFHDLRSMLRGTVDSLVRHQLLQP